MCWLLEPFSWVQLEWQEHCKSKTLSTIFKAQSALWIMCEPSGVNTSDLPNYFIYLNINKALYRILSVYTAFNPCTSENIHNNQGKTYKQTLQKTPPKKTKQKKNESFLNSLQVFFPNKLLTLSCFWDHCILKIPPCASFPCSLCLLKGKFNRPSWLPWLANIKL